MYRLTITQSNPNQPYIVYDGHSLDEITKILELYKSDTDNVKYFINYDIIEITDILVDSYELDNIDFTDLEKQYS